MDNAIILTLSAGMTFEHFDRAARREFWVALLRETSGNVRRAALLACCPRTTVHDQLRSLGICPTDFK